ncbi:MAG TPA: 16S rRNA (cytosine(1402)-N(4))-methyltransferase RsmH [Myxococcota bacterium]|nr:16S rRNA (cytosine(1402)-N(4))-methyltransferase RsmH [Myxococcota bacterium]
MPSPHRSVLLEETIQLLDVAPGMRILDCTLGWGGHSERLLETGATVVGIDRDPDAIEASTLRLAGYGERFRAIRARFSTSLHRLDEPVDGLVADLGVSSPQLDRGERGFSFRYDAPLDMRMGRDGRTAAELIEDSDVSSLARILRSYGEENQALRIAKAIKKMGPSTTGELAQLVEDLLGRRGRIHPATKTFQALRIAVNDEMGELEALLGVLPELLRSGGRAAIISFHSLEDRMVKQRFRELSGIGTEKDPYGNPVEPPLGRLVTRKPVTSSDDNPRARSARLRVWEKRSPR